MGIFKAQNALKPVFGRSSAPDRIGELTMLPLERRASTPHSPPPRRLRRLDLAVSRLLRRLASDPPSSLG